MSSEYREQQRTPYDYAKIISAEKEFAEVLIGKNLSDSRGTSMVEDFITRKKSLDKFWKGNREIVLRGWCEMYLREQYLLNYEQERFKKYYEKKRNIENETKHSNGRVLEDDLENLERLLEYSKQQKVEITAKREGFLETDLTNLFQLIEHAKKRKKRKPSRREEKKDSESPMGIIKPKVRTNGFQYPFRLSFFRQLHWKYSPRHQWEAMTPERIQPSWRPYSRYFGYGRKV